jgi:hypothetical protein
MAAKSRKSDPLPEASGERRCSLQEQVTGTVKVILLTGGLLGGLWLLQMLAKK